MNRRLFRAFVLLLCKRRAERVRDRKQGWAEFFSPPRRFKTYVSRKIRFFEPQALVTRRATFSCLVRSAESPHLVRIPTTRGPASEVAITRQNARSTVPFPPARRLTPSSQAKRRSPVILASTWLLL